MDNFDDMLCSFCTGPIRYFDERVIRTPDSPASVRLR
jgi:hypothetical protein